MKVSLTLPALLVALDGTSASSAAAKKLARNARRLENNNGQYGQYYNGQQQGGEGAEDAWYLQGYSLKMLSCISGEQSVNYERGDVESSTVVFRLCPTDTCGANSTSNGCEEGYGDFAVGINTFAQAYVESIKDNYNNGMEYYSYAYGDFNVEEYIRECSLFEEGEGGGEQNQNYYQSYAYVGAACTDDGTDIKLASFSDPYCSVETEDFADTHNGFELPYSEGGLIPSECMSCSTYNDNYEAEVSEMCKKTYEEATYRCEEKMEYVNQYYGANNYGCSYLEDKIPKASKSWFSKSESDIPKEGNFFTNQPENVKLAEEYIALFVVMGLLSFVLVGYFIKEKVEEKKALKEGVEPKSTSITESVKSAAMLVKVSTMEAVSKVVKLVKSGDEDDDYHKMEKPTIGEATC